VEHLTKYFGGFRVPQITTPRIHAYIEQRSAWECNQCDETFLAGEIEDRTESIYIAAQISSSGSPEREEEAFAIRFLEQGRNRQGEAF
jgi:hypothetical protein